MGPRVSAVALALTLAACSAGDGGRRFVVTDGGPVDAPSGVDAGSPVDSGSATIADGGRPPGCMDPLDVVFVIDVSTSMTEELAAIRDGIRSIWDAAHALTSDTQLGLVVFVDDVVVVNACAPFDTVDALQAQFDTWRAFCSSNSDPASGAQNYDCPENSLDALFDAAQMCPWRDRSTRIAIHVTDDSFAERPTVLSEDPFLGTGVPVAHTYDEVLAALREHEVRVGAFAAPEPGDSCSGSLDVGRGFHTGYAGRPSIPEATGGRAWNIYEVRGGTLDMAQAINELVADEYCTPFF